jgi:hypothetical protein
MDSWPFPFIIKSTPMTEPGRARKRKDELEAKCEAKKTDDLKKDCLRISEAKLSYGLRRTHSMNEVTELGSDEAATKATGGSTLAQAADGAFIERTAMRRKASGVLARCTTKTRPVAPTSDNKTVKQGINQIFIIGSTSLPTTQYAIRR